MSLRRIRHQRTVHGTAALDNATMDISEIQEADEWHVVLDRVDKSIYIVSTRNRDSSGKITA